MCAKCAEILKGVVGMKRIMQKLVVLVVFAGFLAGCNTMAGLGKDMGKLGNKIENKAEEKKSY